MITAPPRPVSTAAGNTSVIHLVQGEHHVTEDPQVMLSTILGSCVAACIRDPRAGIGGMNHFLLPGTQKSRQAGEAERYAAHLMELLVNALLCAGAARGNLEAKLFGGSSVLGGRTDIGERNGSFAIEFLAREGIALTGQCLGGLSGRRLQYWPVSGRARRSFIGDGNVPPPVLPAIPASTGALELF